ncbi:MAG: alpha/beta hydrolase family protein [Thalassotalea sp.]
MKILSFIFLMLSSFIAYSSDIKLSYQDIVSIPDVSNVALSPNGRYVAYMIKVDAKEKQGVLVLMMDTKDNSKKQLAFSENEKYVITSILWGNNDVLLMKAKFPAMRHGTPTTETRLLRVDVKTAEMEPVFPRRLSNKMLYLSNILSNIVDILPEDDNHILMQFSGFVHGSATAVVRVPITDKGKRAKIIQKPRSYVDDWLTDEDSNVRIGIRRDETTYRIIEKELDGGIKTLWEFEAFSREQVWPLGFDADNKTLFVEALHQGKDAIFKVDLSDPKLTKKLVHFDENYDVSNRLRRSPITKEVIGVGDHYWHQEYKNFIESIDKALPDTTNRLIDYSDDGNSYILFASSDNEPGMYLIGNKKEKSLEVLAYRYRKLHPELLAKKEKVSYQARDGLKIEGYLTKPIGAKKENLATIIFPHGGPISYDGKGFDYWTQFFANKGYAVLQMNFRGSSGYGYDFMKQGLGAWGQAMQDDVEDGTRWLIKEGIADKNKICIIGASYGGYAALMGTIKTPDLYQCAVSFAGVTDVEALVKSRRRFTHFEIVKKQIGDDYDKLWQVSPLKHAEKVNTPVLLIHGTKDRVVRVSQSEDMFDELEDEDKVVQYVEIDEADHYLSNNEHRLQTFTAMNQFLDKYLPIN